MLLVGTNDPVFARRLERLSGAHFVAATTIDDLLRLTRTERPRAVVVDLVALTTAEARAVEAVPELLLLTTVVAVGERHQLAEARKLGAVAALLRDSDAELASLSVLLLTFRGGYALSATGGGTRPVVLHHRRQLGR
jgi:hypothetical protein